MKLRRTSSILLTLLLLLVACGGDDADEPDAGAEESTDEAEEPEADEADGDDEAAADEEADGGDEPADEEPTVVRIASILSGQAGYMTALIEHLDLGAEYGLELEVSDLGFVESANALRQDRADVAMMAPSTMLRLATEQGFESTIVGPTNWSGNAWVVRGDSGYDSFEDLQGERIGNFPRTTGAYFFSAVLANSMDLSIDDDFESVEADVSALVALLENGEVEAVNLFQPHISRMLVSGDYEVLVDFDEQYLDLVGARPLKAGYAATPEWVENNPETVAALQSILAETIETIKSGEDEEFFRENADDLFGLTTPEQVDAGFEANQLAYAEPGEWTEENIEVQNDILLDGVDLGLLPEPAEGWQDTLWMDCYYDCPAG